jgi:Carboxypeptidase regulatory-like domain/TonB dependent receptor
MKRLIFVSVFAVSAMLSNRPVFGQAASSTTLVGTVTDSSGGVLTGASIVAVHDATKVTFDVKTNRGGLYRIPFVPEGTYTIMAQSEGFETVVHSNVVVGVNQTVRNDFALKVGEFTTEVTVTGSARHTDDASLSQMIPNATITELPVVGHDTLKMATTTAGVTLASETAVGDPPGEDFHGPGTRGVSNNVRLDGVTIMNTIHGKTNFKPSPDAIQELSVQVGTYSAEYGGYMGVHINAVSKAGGNTFHGVISEALRNDVFDARGYFEDRSAPKNPLRKNQFSAELDGPVVKNKIFFMTIYQGQRESVTDTNVATVMTEKMRQGDFSEILSRVRLADPVDASCIVGNIIQPRCIHPASLALMNFMAPVPNLPGVTENSRRPTRNENNWDQFTARIDHTLNANARMYGRYGYQKATASTGAVYVPDTSYTPSTQDNFVAGHTQVFTSNLVNQFQVGRNKVALNSANGYYLDDSLLPLLDKMPHLPGFENPPGNPGEPSISISGYSGIGSGARNSLQTDEVWSTTNTLSWNHGAHNVVTGFDISRTFTTRFAANGPRGTISFNGTMTGDAAADFMRGLVLSTTTPTVQLESSGLQWKHAYFVADKWSATRNLSLNIGLRYELPMVGSSPSGIGNVLNREGTALVPATQTKNAKFTLPDHGNWAPRLGFAYRMGPNWVLRGGGGIYYNPTTNNVYTILSLNPPYGSNFSYNTSRANPVITLSDLKPLAALGTASPTPNILTIGPEFPTGTMNQWSLSLERSLWTNASVDVQYLGSRSYHLDTSWQRNTPAPGPGPIQARRPNQRFGTIREISNNAWGDYQGMNVIFTQRTHRGLGVTLNYTWSHNLDVSDFSTGGGNITYPDDWRADYGNSSWDIRHRFVGTYTWQMPFFRETKNALLAGILGGWSIGGIVNIASGTPVNVTSGRDVANTGAASQRPDLVGTVDASRCGEVLVACINAGAFAMPAPFTYGNAGRNLFHGPGSMNFDTSLAKNFRASRYTLQVRADVFNTFNRPNFGNPNGNFSSLAFGNITSAGPMRVVELGVRLKF